VIVFYGLIAYLLWREFSGQRRAAIWAAAAVAALGFNEAYSRVYLTLHWFTDALSGLLYGGLLLAVFVAAVRVVAGPAPAAARASRETARAVRAPATQEAAP
jgi:membrane-associated phospholipid phosphatase